MWVSSGLGTDIISADSDIECASPSPFVAPRRCWNSGFDLMRGFLDELERGLAACGACEGRILVAVSGGADSVALLRGLARICDDAPRWLVVAHFHHGWRGAASDADARWAAKLADQHDLEFVRGDAANTLKRNEETAREVRYAFLQESAEKCGCLHVATAHTADDQAETVLHHVLRGTGLAGLRGIPRRRPLSTTTTLVRPLLHVTARQAKAFLAEIAQDYRVDATNAELRHTRNRLRHDLMPALARDYNPRVIEALGRLSRQAEEAEETLRDLAKGAIALTTITKSDGRIDVDLSSLRSLPRAVLRTAWVRLWSEWNWPRQAMGYEDWDALATLTLETTRRHAARTFPGGIDVRRVGQRLTLTRTA